LMGIISKSVQHLMVKIHLFFCKMKIALVPQGKRKESKSIHLCKRWQLLNPQEHGGKMKSMIPLSKFFSDFFKIIVYVCYNYVSGCVNS
jgi:hypothetical protein